ncbi:hypothetical protein [Nocardioides zhouii]|uniref:Uncharacterized protein n=1 Tax=Nocardioides zhouii TaxID=1168729 RepID=A0A4Q2SSS3_9ACTN|nr:hypothetical protein [Nocardioides zhouii]RYC07444.1 hypothetical protein EUA94_14195 [Nocardioides zhouii]
MYTVPEQLSELAGTCLSSSQAVADAWTGALGAFGSVAGAAGNTAGGGSFVSAHTTASESADLAFGRFMSVLEQDMDDLYAVAFDMTTTDESTAATYGAGTPSTSRPGGPR